MKEKLTPAEITVLVMLSHGLLYKEIAARRTVAMSTTKHHIKNIYWKLQAKNAAHAISIAYLEGILPVQTRLF